ncbi:MAG: hypothetical protein LBS63_03195, partial [Prevotellaceae bacterium]|nr:hypothetical protein [Prevotellaceae bacterium]
MPYSAQLAAQRKQLQMDKELHDMGEARKEVADRVGKIQVDPSGILPAPQPPKPYDALAAKRQLAENGKLLIVEAKAEADRLDRIIEPLRQKVDSERTEHYTWRYGAEGKPIHVFTDEYKQRRSALKIAEAYRENIYKIAKAAEKGAGFRSLMQGVTDADWVNMATLGVKQLEHDFDLLAIAHRRQQGAPLTEEESAALEAYAVAKGVASGVESPWTYTAAAGAMESIPFMAQIALGGGVGRVFGAGAKLATTRALGSQLSGTLGGKVAAAGAEAIAAAAGSTLANAPMVGQNFANFELGDLDVTPSDGASRPTVATLEGAHGAAANIGLAYAQAMITTLAEASGGYLAKVVDRARRLHPNSATKVLQFLMGSPEVSAGKGKTIFNAARKYVMLDKFLPELGEEMVEGVADILFLPETAAAAEARAYINEVRAEQGLDPVSRWGDFFSKDNLLATATSVALMTTGMGGAQRGAAMLAARANRLSKATRAELDRILSAGEGEEQRNAALKSYVE